MHFNEGHAIVNLNNIHQSHVNPNRFTKLEFRQARRKNKVKHFSTASEFQKVLKKTQYLQIFLFISSIKIV